jgi:hypothetical protein
VVVHFVLAMQEIEVPSMSQQGIYIKAETDAAVAIGSYR